VGIRLAMSAGNIGKHICLACGGMQDITARPYKKQFNGN
jgi:hypothetical protein